MFGICIILKAVTDRSVTFGKCMTKQDIINTAFKTWGRTLYQTTSLAELASELGVSKPALYRHFKNKDAILQAMYEKLFDEYSDFFKIRYENAVSDAKNGKIHATITIIMRIVGEYFIRNKEAFVFFLFGSYFNEYMQQMVIESFYKYKSKLQFEENEEEYPSLTQLMLVHLVFTVGYFHKTSPDTPTEETVQKLLLFIEEIIRGGLGVHREIIETLDYEKLESMVAKRHYDETEENSIFKAVATAVAEAGNWNASMDMVARRAGMSKSGLYYHFQNKRDMLRKLFMSELNIILEYVKEAVTWSNQAEEQFYLAIFSVAHYLRAKPEILLSADWIKTRRLNLEIIPPPELFKIFSDIRAKISGVEQETFEAMVEQIERTIFFEIANILTHRPEGMSLSDLPNGSIRRLFKFVALGIEGFKLN